MSAEVATSAETGSKNPIANVAVYWKVSGIALAVVALLGLTVNAIGGNYAYVPDAEVMQSVLVFDWTHDVVHVGLAAIALAMGFGSFSEQITRNTAKAVGIVYIALGLVGFVPAVTEFLQSALGLGLEAGENVIHLALGSWGAYAGFTG